MEVKATNQILSDMRLADRLEAAERFSDAASLQGLAMALQAGLEAVALSYRDITGRDLELATLEEAAPQEAPAPEPEPEALEEEEPEASAGEVLEAEEYFRAEMRAFDKAQTSRLFNYVVECGGIRPSTPDLREEYREIPPTYRRPHGVPGDEMADLLRTDMPELGIESERDLLEFFAERRRQARNFKYTGKVS